MKGHREKCRSSDKREIGTYGNVNEVDRVKTGQQDDSARYCILKVLNTRGQHLEPGKNVPLGQAEPLKCTPPKGAGINFRRAGSRDKAAQRISSLTGRNSRELREKRNQLEGKLEHLSPTEKHTLLSVIDEYLDLFCNEETGVLPSTTKGRHEIRTGDALPIKKNPYRVPYALKDEMKRQLDDMLDKGVITPCASQWAAPVILVPKKSQDGRPKYRFCTDFRGLNSATMTPV
jgi:hypothetical protein